jgi:RNA polymerase sigma-70 factor, ECF subfamily
VSGARRAGAGDEPRTTERATRAGATCSPRRSAATPRPIARSSRRSCLSRGRSRGAICGRKEAVEDAVQDALLTLHRIRHTYEPGRPVEPWLAAIVNRRSIDIARRSGRTGSREVHDETAFETFADPGANKQEAAEAADSIAHMLGELTPKQREAVELVKLKEMSLAEASAESGQSIGSLKVNVHRAIQRLRRGLNRDAGSGRGE